MKKLIFTIAAIVIASSSIFAQEEPNNSNRTDYREKLLFGFKAGANYANVYDVKSVAFDADARWGFATGAFIAIPFSTLIGVQPEILFSQKGFQGNNNILGKEYKFSRTTNHIDVPLMFALKPTEFITILAGPQYSYLLSQKDVYTYGNTSIANESEFSNSNLRKNTLCFTGGFDFTMKHLVVGLRVGWDLQKNNGDGSTSTMVYKNTWYQATVGYRFYSNN
jgi:hypothetical protein